MISCWKDLCSWKKCWSNFWGRKWVSRILGNSFYQKKPTRTEEVSQNILCSTVITRKRKLHKVPLRVKWIGSCLFSGRIKWSPALRNCDSQVG